ncbi:polymeric immunoglobulin receptor-like [Sardina pilchardus]|uniref:polymeric immunoglobulin receptor-like n=1 Tax=Sardina pilchardus TaxID=27697 RepID=UPI002E0F8CB0
MKLCLCLLYTALQVTVGCIISEPEEETITRSPGESVLLSCSCTDLQTTPDEIQWSFASDDKKWFHTMTGDLNPEVKKRYSGRVQTFSDRSPENASLLLSNLTEEDQGDYICQIEMNTREGIRVITLIVKREEPGYGCKISEAENETITRSPGESVLLSCSCTDLQTTPDGIRWRVIDKTGGCMLLGDLNEEEKKRYGGRVQTFNNSFPGNMSLLLSDLTEEDQGDYFCEIETNKKGGFRLITLIVKREEAGDGCIISERENETITRSPGESVLLSCSCTDLQTKPDEIQWRVIDKTGYYVLTGDLNPEENKRYSGRVQTFSDSSPGNASLLLSKLTEEDQGKYTCASESNESEGIRVITLIIKGN